MKPATSTEMTVHIASSTEGGQAHAIHVLALALEDGDAFVPGGGELQVGLRDHLVVVGDTDVRGALVAVEDQVAAAAAEVPRAPWEVLGIR